MTSEELPPGPTWSEVIAVIRQHDWQTANRLENHRYLLYSRAWSVAHRMGVAYSDANRKISQSTALAELESEALELFEKLRQDGDRSTVAALESRGVESREPDPV